MDTNIPHYNLLKSMTSLIDLRSPKEFEKGAFPQSINLPILNDDEREKVGKTYKNQSKEQAIALGHHLVSGDCKNKRIMLWKDFIQANPMTQIYCARGGLRSEIAQSWLKEVGVNVSRIEGGFQTLRQTALDILDFGKNDNKRWIILGGRTGTGKTDILSQLDSSIDLEARANHRGSAFGGTLSAQPKPIAFENALTMNYLSHENKTLLLEDESRTIGRLAIPNVWYERMRISEWVMVEISIEERIQNIIKDYIEMPLDEGLSKIDLLASLQSSLFKIQKRLGLVLYMDIQDKLNKAFSNSKNESHEDWIKLLLQNYYDAQYDYQFKTKMERCIYRSDTKGVISFLQDLELS
ncbi:MAG: tRNA 2-selenouridine(34) synthase MnmH [Candidatus Marinimicrobia bacterium]|nr:tRNA 2-selenouridine(34) synthase MnmH [Candidatus Neomarinimicrobiota bacterium]MBT5355086.1 tRNA 2-selenouridine(34) synthase MnmH [Candidatus Neomarinimicrobiota bacterium]